MAVGMVFAALAFVAATLVEINVTKTVVNPAPAAHCHVQVFNLAKGNVSVSIQGSDMFPEPIPYLQDPPRYEMLQLGESSKNLHVEATFEGRTSVCNQLVHERTAYSLILSPDGNGLSCKLAKDFLKKNETGIPLIRFFNTLPAAINLTVGDVVFTAGPGEMSENKTVERGRYSQVSCALASGPCSPLDLDLLEFGALYTIILIEENENIVPYKMEDVEANSIHIALQIPQYALMTAGEVMFSITGLEFSYSQAPANMKSVLQAGWLLTVAFGNVIVLIVAEGAGLEQWVEFLLFASLLLGVCIIFSIMAHFYTYVDPEQMVKLYMEDGDEVADDAKDTKKKMKDMALKDTSEGTKL